MENTFQNLNIKSSWDIREDFNRLCEGDNEIKARPSDDMVLIVRAEVGKPLSLRIVDKNGHQIRNTIEMKVNNTDDKGETKTTCWECGVDDKGNRHCCKIPCPIIVGPWTPS